MLLDFCRHFRGYSIIASIFLLHRFFRCSQNKDWVEHSAVSRAKCMKLITSACIWPPNMAAKEIILTWFFVKNSCTIIQSLADRSWYFNNYHREKHASVEFQCTKSYLQIWPLMTLFQNDQCSMGETSIP